MVTEIFQTEKRHQATFKCKQRKEKGNHVWAQCSKTIHETILKGDRGIRDLHSGDKNNTVDFSA